MDRVLMQNLDEDDKINYYLKSIYDKPVLTDIKQTFGLLALINWDEIARLYQLSEEFIDKYKDWFNWDIISGFQLMSEKFIEDHLDYINWTNLIQDNECISIEFLEKHEKDIDPRDLLFNPTIPDDYKLAKIDNIDFSGYTAIQIYATIKFMLLHSEKTERFEKYAQKFEEIAKKINK